MTLTTMPEHTPFAPPRPPPNAQDTCSKRLDDQQEEAYQAVLDHFSRKDYALPTKGELADEEDDFSFPTLEKGELTEDEKFWLSCECMLRFLRACKWNVTATIQRLEDTLRWRREFGLYSTVTPEHVEPEAVTGKQIIYGFDCERRPAFYMFPSRQNTEEPTRQCEFAVWMMERAIDLMGPGVESVTLLINCANRTKKPSMSSTRRTLSVIQRHYPERLGTAMIINVPFWMSTFYALIAPFIDPYTRAKLRFNSHPVKEGLFSADMLMREWNGTRNFVWSHDKYWSELIQLSERRRKAWRQRWRELGGHVGIKEWDYKRGCHGC